MIVVEENFMSMADIGKRWNFNTPWGAGKDKLGIYSRDAYYHCIGGSVIMGCKPSDEFGYLMPRLFWKGAPMGFGRYEALMKVPPQNSVNVFVLYTQAHYNNVIRSIMPEIDVAEYGLHNHPTKLNVAVHQWSCRTNFKSHPAYADIEDRHTLDYMGHKIKDKQIDKWDGKIHHHMCEVTAKKCTIYLDGDKVLSVRGKFYPFFTPTFGQVLPKWVDPVVTLPIEIMNFKYSAE